MAEEGQEGAEATAVVDPVVEAQPVPFLNSDGTFTESWRDNLDEDIRGEKCLDSIKDFPNMVKSFVHGRRMIGQEQIAKPNENSTSSEWEEYHKAGGRPDTAMDYGFKKPDDYPEELYNEGLAATAMELFHKIGLSQKQADALLAFNLEGTLSAHTNAVADWEANKTQSEASIYAEWGSAKEQKLHFGKLALEAGTDGDEGFRQSLTNKYGNDVEFIKLMANLGAKFSEHGLPSGDHIPTPQDIQEQINELMATDAYQNRDNPGYKAMTAKVARLFAEKAASTAG